MGEGTLKDRREERGEEGGVEESLRLHFGELR